MHQKNLSKMLPYVVDNIRKGMKDSAPLDACWPLFGMLVSHIVHFEAKAMSQELTEVGTTWMSEHYAEERTDAVKASALKVECIRLIEEIVRFSVPKRNAFTKLFH